MRVRHPSTWLLATITMMSLASRASAGPTPAQLCQGAKNEEAGKYDRCRQKAEAGLATSGDNAKYTAAQAKCLTKYQAKWPTLEAKAGGACPSVGDQAAIQGVIDQHTTNIATALGGGVLQGCPADLFSCQGGLGTCYGGLTTCTGNLTTCTSDLGTCNTTLAGTQTSLTACNTNLASTQMSLTACNTGLGTCNGNLTTCQNDLTTCQAAPRGQRLKTDQTTCYDIAGTVIACAGTGQDGDLEKGLARAYTDNANGTITDTKTGLMWEKLSDDGSIHDKDTPYTWTNAFATKVATLNSTSFAGFNDWRVPNVNELQSLASYGAVGPAINAAFNTGCAASCTVLTCSCTQSNLYWSSSTYQLFPNNAWLVDFGDGDVFALFKTDPNRYVRAVRGGS